MEIKNQLSAEEEELINGCKNEDQKAIKELFDKCDKIIKAIFEKKKISTDQFSFNCWRGEIKEDVFMAVKKNKIKTNLFGYVKVTAKNYLNNKIHQIQKEKKWQHIDNIVETEDFKSISPEPKKHYKKKTKKNISLELQKCLDISLEYILALYKLKKEMKPVFDKYEFVIRTSDALIKTKKQFNYILGRVSEEKISSHEFSVLKEPLAPDKIAEAGIDKQEFKIWAHKKLNDFMVEIDCFILGGIIAREIIIPLFNFHSPFFGLLWSNQHSGSYREDEIDALNFFMSLTKMKVESPRLIYDIWSKAKEFKRGEMVNNKMIEKIYENFREKTWGTEKGDLFKSSVKIDSLRKRKMAYRKASDKRFYKAIVNFIYRKSFIEKERPA